MLTKKNINAHQQNSTNKTVDAHQQMSTNKNINVHRQNRQIKWNLKKQL
jgi:hypothetical protein